ncbi:glutathione S-transferase family protein [Caulobacter sp. 17J80-11]|uniref:glutathione S-transferase family protein n=1 Tax=Caulobacter sp. 17J80-11 TaxID=2763502 RepID=UPI001653E883|nr:glutathione S-transferase family protein [Caulobacter sp. 17J80-11]MBC6982830.1 glutathione S-transferase family protein [Caulobacter sp. 17J80-11]
MKLYSANLSPFAARVRLAVYAKGLSLEIAMPPGGPKSAEYLAMNPIGKIPTLVLDDGRCLPESDTIVEYLEDLGSGAPLLPADPAERARVRLLARVGESYVMGPLQRLFGQTNPATRDAAVAAREMKALDEGLAHLNVFLAGAGGFSGKITFADCQLVPTLFFVRAMTPALGDADMLERHEAVAGYFAQVAQDPSALKVLDELRVALETFMTKGQLT